MIVILSKVGWQDVDWILLAEVRDLWWSGYRNETSVFCTMQFLDSFCLGFEFSTGGCENTSILRHSYF